MRSFGKERMEGVIQFKYIGINPWKLVKVWEKVKKEQIVNSCFGKF